MNFIWQSVFDQIRDCTHDMEEERIDETAESWKYFKEH